MVRAEIVGDGYACGGTRAGTLLALCRELMKIGHDPAMPLEVCPRQPAGLYD
jgi:hypothetical protein